LFVICCTNWNCNILLFVAIISICLFAYWKVCYFLTSPIFLSDFFLCSTIVYIMHHLWACWFFVCLSMFIGMCLLWVLNTIQFLHLFLQFCFLELMLLPYKSLFCSFDFLFVFSHYLYNSNFLNSFIFELLSMITGIW
jgi:hypothetical protein